MNAVTSSTRHAAHHCGHVGRSTSAAVKRAAVLFGCEQDVPEFVVPDHEPADVMALLALMRAGASCDQVGAAVEYAEWLAAAEAWAAHHDEPWFVLPAAGLPWLAAVAGR